MNDRLSSIEYPESTDQHMIVVKQKSTTVFDENYPYWNRGFFFRIAQAVLWFCEAVIGAFILWVIIGARVKGRENLRKNKHLLKNGAVSVCNHVHFYDAIVVNGALLHYNYYPAWDQNCRGPNRFMIRATGGIPVPTNPRGLRAMNRAFDNILASGRWVHFFPEGSMWWYFKPIRPFKKAAFSFAVKHNVPIIPLAFSYREPTGLYKLLGRKDPLLTLNVGAPILPPEDGTVNERVAALKLAAENECARLAGTVRFESLTEEEKEKYLYPNAKKAEEAPVEEEAEAAEEVEVKVEEAEEATEAVEVEAVEEATEPVEAATEPTEPAPEATEPTESAPEPIEPEPIKDASEAHEDISVEHIPAEDIEEAFRDIGEIEPIFENEIDTLSVAGDETPIITNGDTPEDDGQ